MSFIAAQGQREQGSARLHAPIVVGGAAVIGASGVSAEPTSTSTKSPVPASDGERNIWPTYSGDTAVSLLAEPRAVFVTPISTTRSAVSSLTPLGRRVSSKLPMAFAMVAAPAPAARASRE